MGIRLLSGLYIGKESLQSHGTAISTVADNLANQNTPGFKASRAEFEDMLAESIGSLYGAPLSAGSGTKIEQLSPILKQGILEPTEREFDFAIQGNGYFVVNDGATNYFTRAGNFTTDANNNIVTEDGDTLMGYANGVADTEAPTALSLANIATTASPTTAATLGGNLSASAPLTTLPPGGSTFQQINALASYKSSVQVVDSLGAIHDVGLFFFHTAALGWTAQAYVDGGEVGGVAGTPTLLGSADITFDGLGSQGENAATAINVTPAWGNGAAASAIAINLGAFTGLGGSSTLSSVVADGNAPGQVVGIEMGPGGALFARLDNGRTTQVGTVALAMFNNPGGLTKVGDNKFAVSDTSGAAVTRAAEVEGRGAVANQVLESSTVDPAGQFIDMVRYQRGYQAGSSIIKTVNELLNTTIQLA